MQLLFSRRQIIEPTLLDINAVVAHMRPMLERLIGEDVKVVLSLGPKLALVKADQGQMEQILMNLAVNARDAMPHGGTLTIATANVELDDHFTKTHVAGKSARTWSLTPTDTGSGQDARRSRPSPVRAIFHHQGTWQRHGARPSDRPGRCRAKWRERHCQQ